MGKELFAGAGIPDSKTFFDELDSFKKLLNKERLMQREPDGIFIDGNIAHLSSKGKAIFVGDLHGDFEALVSIVKQSKFLEAMEKKQDMFLVFLGDYGDRGKKIIETISGVVRLKQRYPQNVILLKGNHEEYRTAEAYGTLDVMIGKYGNREGESLFRFYCDVVDKLPAVAVAVNGIIGVHGGIPNQDIDSLSVLNGKQGTGIIREMTWNDPHSYLSERAANSRGGSTTTFGKNAFLRFMDRISANVMVRSHQYPTKGVELLFDDRLATIFSNGSERSCSSAYSRHVDRAVFFMTDLGETKYRFEDSDFTEVAY